MEHVEESDVPRENRQRFPNILKAQLDIFIARRRDLRPVSDLSLVQVQAEHGLPALAFPQIKGQQPDAATDVQDGILRRTQQFIRGGVDLVVAYFAPHIMAEPPLRELRRDPRTRIFVFRRVFCLRFHLLRIIALPD